MASFVDFAFATDEEVAKALGQRIKQARLAKGLQQQELAERAGMVRATLVKLENHGKCTLLALISVVRVLRLEGALQELFVLPEPVSIAQMEAQAIPLRKRAPNKPRNSRTRSTSEPV